MSNLVIKAWDGGEWKELDSCDSLDSAERTASDLRESGYTNVKIFDEKDSPIKEYSDWSESMNFVKEFSHKIEEKASVDDLVEASVLMSKLIGRKLAPPDASNKILNAIANVNAGDKTAAYLELNSLRKDIKFPVRGLEDAIYHLAFWKDDKDLDKAIEIIKANELDTTDVELAKSYIKASQKANIGSESARYIERATLCIKSTLDKIQEYTAKEM